MKLRQMLSAMAFLAVATVATAGFGQSPDQEFPRPDTTLVDRFGEVVFQESVSQELGKYWIGLSCDNAGDALRSHLGIADGEGLLCSTR